MIDILEHEPLVISILKRYGVDAKDDEDMKQVGMVGLVKAGQYFDQSRGYKFSTFAFACIKSEIINEFKRRKNRIATRSLSENIEADQEFEQIDNRLDAWHLWNKLDNRQRAVIHKRFFKSQTLISVGEQFSLSKERVRQIETEALNKMRGFA